jgi:hypothetical protein
MSAAVSLAEAPGAHPGVTRSRTLPRSSWERRRLKARLEQLRYDRRQELRRARHAVGYVRARAQALSAERDRGWARYLVEEIAHAVPYIAGHRQEARRLLKSIVDLARSLEGA